MQILTDFRLLRNIGAHISRVGTCANTRESLQQGRTSIRGMLKLNEGALMICFKVKNRQQLNTSEMLRSLRS